YLELKSDGSYFLFEGFAGVTGTYEINGAEITLFSGDSTSQATIQDGVITDTEGDKWVRAKATQQPATGSSKCPNCKSDLLETAKFCPNCGAVVNAPGKAPIAAQNLTNRTSSEDPLASISWLPAVLKKDLPWELYEAGAWVVVLVVLFIFFR